MNCVRAIGALVSLAGLLITWSWVNEGRAAPVSGREKVLGYINHIPPESPQDREIRHQRVAERRKGMPILVHRGAWKIAPENTLEAYAAAMDCGADGIEIDIRRSADGVLYMLHDDTLDRMTTCSGKARSRTYYELLQCRFSKVFGQADDTTRIPTLAAVLVLARQRAALLHLDVKESGLEDAIERMFDEADVWDHVVEVNAGNAERLRGHPKVRLLPYKGWFPQGKYENDPAAHRDMLSKSGVMIFCEDPRAAVAALKRTVPDPVPLPMNLRVEWTPAGPVTTRAVAPVAGRHAVVSEDAARAWVRHVVPLPKEIEIRAAVVVGAGEVAITSVGGSDPLVAQAVRELAEITGGSVGGSSRSGAAFTVTMRLGGSEAEPLRRLKNPDQAYRIEPVGERGLKVAAIAPRGLYYAAKTLKQLVAARTRDGVVEMPILSVTDWPDLEDRGTWGADNYEHLEWFADRKLNLVEQISDIGVHEDGRPYGRLKGGREPMITLGPKLGIQPVPVVLHLEQVSQKGVYRAHPELKAQGGQEGAICYSKPAIVDVIAGWIAALGKLPGVNEVDVWMTENLHGQGGCQCDECRKTPYAVLEARAIVAGWKKARQEIGDVGLRVLTSEETENSNPLVLAMLPPEVKVWYYHSLLTYTSGESPMLRTYLAESARKGRWVGVCPSLVSSVHCESPFTGAAFVHYRMKEFVSKGMSGLLAYVTPRTEYARFNLEAAAEWSWNVNGRSTREFAASWAVRRGIRDAEKFAEWSETLGPVAWDVYGSDWPAGEQRGHPGPVASLLREGKLPDLGSVLWGVYRSPWGDIRSVDQLNDNVVRADKAVALARELGLEECIQESLVVQGYIRALQALWELKRLVTPEGVAAENRDAARRCFAAYIGGMKQAASSLPKWEAAVAGRSHGHEATGKTVRVVNGAVEQMEKLAKEMGVMP